MAPAEADVLIVGAGPVGLSLAIELGSRGIAVRLIEQRARAGAQPRAKTTNVRTMQHMRRWGIADALRDAAPLPYDYPTDIVFATTMLGHTIAVIENALDGAKSRDPRFPEPTQWVPQYVLERVLLQRVAQFPSVRIAQGVAIEEASQSAHGVVATVRDTKSGTPARLSARYLVGPDGARSRVRAIIGARMQGEHAMGRHYNLVLRISALAPARRAIMYWLINPAAPSILSRLENDLWAFGLTLPPGVETISDDEVVRRAHAAIGAPVRIEVVERDIWAAHRLVADRYRDRRILLAGDACHLHPPFGGYGMNLGVGDAVDLGWKLSAVLQGWGGDALLDSYEQERRPTHLRTIAEAVENYRTLSEQLVREELDDGGARGAHARDALAQEILATKSREFCTLGVVLGSRYQDSPIIVGDGSAPPTEHFSRYQPSAHPGCLAPHAWLDDGSSLYDHFGTGFTLLVLNNNAAALAQQIVCAAQAARVPLKRLDLHHASLETLYAAPLALVRPDQFVAWRGARIEPARLLQKICGQELQAEDLNAEGLRAQAIGRMAYDDRERSVDQRHATHR